MMVAATDLRRLGLPLADDAPASLPVVADSRQVTSGAVFVACAPAPVDRAAHLRQAHERGAAWSVAERDDGPAIAGAWLPVAEPRAWYARAVVRAHGLQQGEHPPLVGITGTDGKTSVACFVQQLTGLGAARIGTLGASSGLDVRPATHTTPPTAELCRFIQSLPSACPVVAIECSSHGLAQGRLGDLPLAAGVFTGLGRDHFDYHGDQEAYRAAKLRLVAQLAPGAVLVVNADDPVFEAVRAAAVERDVVVIGLGVTAGDWRLVEEDDGGVALRSVTDDRSWPVVSPSPGLFNFWNVAAACLVLRSLGHDLDEVIARSQHLRPVPGRLERIGQQPIAYVDYAHTPDAIERVLAVVRQAHSARRLVCVFGCGGDRDRGKRPVMGRAALAADLAVLTADNPRSEAQSAIAADVLAGLDEQQRQRCHRHDDRGRAIAEGLRLAGPAGVLVVCGKGHEQEQEIAGQRRPWDDRAVLRQLLAQSAGEEQ